MSKQVDQDAELNYHMMFDEENRIASFKDWPYDEQTTCPASKMAAAGFYHCPTDQEPDLVKCFVCLKELDGWDPTDDPVEEHRSHSGKCEFLKLQEKTKGEITVCQLLDLECERQINMVRKNYEAKVASWKSHAEATREEMTHLVD